MHDHLAVAVERHHHTGEGQAVGGPLAQVMAQLFQLGVDGLDFGFQRARLRRVPLRQTSCRLPLFADDPRRSDTTCKEIIIRQSSWNRH
jgi:hypothetical protein